MSIAELVPRAKREDGLVAMGLHRVPSAGLDTASLRKVDTNPHDRRNPPAPRLPALPLFACVPVRVV